MKRFTLLLFFLPQLIFSQGLGIGTDNPTEMLDVNGKIRMRTGASKGAVLVSDSIGSSTWTSLGSLMGDYGLWVTHFGAIPNDGKDDSGAIQAAIDSARVLGRKVFFPAGGFDIWSTLTVPEGVNLVGEGIGDKPHAAPNKGTVILYMGSKYAIELQGSASGIEDLSVRDGAGEATGGIRIQAKGSTLTSIKLSRLYIYGFVKGTGLTLSSDSGKGITHSSFYDLKIHHAKFGIRINENGAANIKSNVFYGGIISGAGFDNCLKINGGHDNEFLGLSIKTFQSTYGHVVVESGQMVARGINIVGMRQPKGVPLVKFEAGTYESILDGEMRGGIVVDEGTNDVKLISRRNLQAQSSGVNLLHNSSFQRISGQTIPDWSFSNENVHVEQLEPELLHKHMTLKITVAPGEYVFLGPNKDKKPFSSNMHHDLIANFGAYMKTTSKEFAYSTNRTVNGVKSSLAHPGNDDWHFVGMRGESPKGKLLPQFYFDNSKGTDSAVVYLSCPTFSYGYELPKVEATPFTSAGGEIYGTISASMMEVPSPADHRLVLPQQANTFIITGTEYITRINNETKNRFLAGTCITLLFDEGGIGVNNSPYIRLVDSYISKANSSLSLLSMGNGTWRELNRNL